jgi:hypothetical protein
MVATTTVIEELRAGVRAGGSLRSLSRRSNIDRAVLLRFRRGERSITIDTAVSLAEALGKILILAEAPESSR